MKFNYKNKELGKKLNNEKDSLISIIADLLGISPNTVASLPLNKLRQMASVALHQKKIIDSELLRNFDLTHADAAWHELFEKYHHAKQSYIHENSNSKKYVAPQSKVFEVVKIFNALRVRQTLVNLLNRTYTSDVNPLNNRADVSYSNDNQLNQAVSNLPNQEGAFIGK